MPPNFEKPSVPKVNKGNILKLNEALWKYRVQIAFAPNIINIYTFSEKIGYANLYIEKKKKKRCQS